MDIDNSNKSSELVAVLKSKRYHLAVVVFCIITLCIIFFTFCDHLLHFKDVLIQCLITFCDGSYNILRQLLHSTPN